MSHSPACTVGNDLGTGGSFRSTCRRAVHYAVRAGCIVRQACWTDSLLAFKTRCCRARGQGEQTRVTVCSPLALQSGIAAARHTAVERDVEVNQRLRLVSVRVGEMCVCEVCGRNTRRTQGPPKGMKRKGTADCSPNRGLYGGSGSVTLLAAR